ncbi:TetR/AcrR family transcriptional regulator [Limosilactobacillus sp.]|jgi:AcrR family transcriptional regulator|uniref:TetR/AcrR family transcriptional regulator n=1 Tax=Limosilactobacillus sp. TaxID=2773925 RepID=UPI0025BE8DA5|nr:TetR/AcrR family transcriptional regulator [Limosilactobacillus sp.]MCH3921942.1 TetR/AcrR family transcriptional regulator [Limosilactobacillus sp.]MCH3928713.1 TetR/AcrR family transcriptional regulator [Limosilactobacillus sp.]
MNENVTVKHVRQRQIEQTQADFTEALYRLLKKEKLAKINIAQLCTTAGYARRTFYRHYSSVADLLLQEVDRQTLALMAQLKNANDFEAVVQCFFTYWAQHTALLTILRQNDSFHLLINSWTHHLEDSELSQSDVKDNLYAQFFGVGGMFQMLYLWSWRDFQETPAQMQLIADQITDHLKKNSFH